jgi:N-acetylglucosamine-6-phosphate deacetylase
MATCEEAAAAADKGMTGATHLFNAMRPFNHREPGVIGCALTDPRITCELICDLRHVSAPAVRLAVRAKGIDRITMISDGDFFSGLPEGAYTWGSQALTVSDGLCYLPDGTIRGSAQTLADGVKNMFDLGFRPEEIAVMACVNPAKACGCTDRGELIPGNRADIVILDRDFRVKDVFLGGILRNP